MFFLNINLTIYSSQINDYGVITIFQDESNFTNSEQLNFGIPKNIYAFIDRLINGRC